MPLQIDNIFFRYPRQENWCLNDVSLKLESGKTVGLLGASGSGKSTCGKIAAGLISPASGQVLFHDKGFTALPKRDSNRTKVQMIFQHAEVSFNPRLTLETSMAEGYKLSGKEYSFQALCDMAATFGIYDCQLKRYPQQLSGGELQRLAIARALLYDPEVLILDEATTMLDVITQAHIMRMLVKLKEERNLAYLLITHDKPLAQIMCDEILEMKNGTVMKTTHSIE